jgi:UDP-N-acetylmuramate--alanine ligase
MVNPAVQIHFIGIGGYGMSAIARVLLEMGMRVSGSDMVQKDLTDELAKKGAKVYIGHKKENVKGAGLIVYSSDIPQDNVELQAAKEYNIPLIHRSDLLAQLINEKSGIAVAGSHGKTTTSSMISLVMERAGADPTYIVGGELIDIGSNARFGNGPFVVAEADESDGTFLKYRPYIGVITNIEPDHLENYNGDFSRLKAAFAQFIQRIKPDGKAVLCGDDADLREMIPTIKGEKILYGIDHEDVDYRAINIEIGNRRVSFTVVHKGSVLGDIHLSVPGRHNVYNALAAMCVCLEAGIPFETIAREISHFHGAKRRFQVIGEVKDVLIVDDYAVHPTEIQATISAAKSTGRRIIAVFQPHRISRAYYLLEAFSHSFGEADEVIITDIYSPKGEKKIEGVSAKILSEKIEATSNSNIRYLPTKEEVLEYLKKSVMPGDLVLTLGAGDIWKVAKELTQYLETVSYQ